MCVVSMVMADWERRTPWVLPQTEWPRPTYPNAPTPLPTEEYNSAAEIEKLRKEFLELKKLIIAAKEYDAATNQKDCEMAERLNCSAMSLNILG